MPSVNNRFWSKAVKLVGICVTAVALLITAGNYLRSKDIRDKPLVAGESVEVKVSGKNSWTAGYVLGRTPEGHAVVGIGANPTAASASSAQRYRIVNDSLVRRRKAPSP